MDNQQTKNFSEYALEHLLELYKNHDNEVGRELKKQFPDKYKDYKSTDCITYVLNVLRYAFNKKADSDAAKKVWAVGSKGTDLAKYLVKHKSWKGVYINPDVNHPTDSNDEHTYTAIIAAKRCEYYRIPLAYQITNYRVTPKTHTSFQKVNTEKAVTTLDSVSIASLESVKFGFGISRGGMHTWLYSKGKVYEVHWDAVGPKLYEATSLRKYPWISGAIFIPSDQKHLLSKDTLLKCG